MRVRSGFVVVLVLTIALASLASCVGDDPSVAAPAADDAAAGGADTGSSQDGAPAPDSGAGDSQPFDAGADAIVTTDAGIAGVGGISLWLAGDANVAVNASNQITSWASRAGAPFVVTTAPGATAPTKGTINGHASVHFDGHASTAPCPCPGMSTPLATPINQPLTVFAVVKSDRWNDGTANYESIVFADSPVTLRLYNSVESGPQPIWAANAGTKLLSIAQSSAAFLAPHLVTAVFAGGTSLIRLDGSDPSERAGAVGAAGLVTAFVLGGDGDPLHSLQGDIGDLVFFGRVLTAPERVAVETELKAKWGIP